jgi:hypothetical protein
MFRLNSDNNCNFQLNLVEFSSINFFTPQSVAKFIEVVCGLNDTDLFYRDIFSHSLKFWMHPIIFLLGWLKVLSGYLSICLSVKLSIIEFNYVLEIYVNFKIIWICHSLFGLEPNLPLFLIFVIISAYQIIGKNSYLNVLILYFLQLLSDLLIVSFYAHHIRKR